MLKVGVIGFLLSVVFAAGIVTAKTKPMVARKPTIKFAAQGPDAGTADLSAPFVAISYPSTWSAGSFTFAAETSCYDHGSKTLTMNGFVRDSGKAARGSVLLTYDAVSGNVLWKGSIVSNNPTTLAATMTAAAALVRNLVSSGTVIPEQIQ